MPPLTILMLLLQLFVPVACKRFFAVADEMRLFVQHTDTAIADVHQKLDELETLSDADLLRIESGEMGKNRL